jgi:hypothetical protein
MARAVRGRRTTMGWVPMSERDARRIQVLTEVLFGQADCGFGCNGVGDHRPALC